jgi:hypothetical protein
MRWAGTTRTYRYGFRYTKGVPASTETGRLVALMSSFNRRRDQLYNDFLDLLVYLTPNSQCIDRMDVHAMHLSYRCDCSTTRLHLQQVFKGFQAQDLPPCLAISRPKLPPVCSAAYGTVRTRWLIPLQLHSLQSHRGCVPAPG